MSGSSWRRLLSRHGVAVLSLAVAALAWAGLFFGARGLLPQLEERSSDLVWRLGADRQQERRIIAVDVDERSLREIGPWPWSYDIQARLINQIAAAGARQQIFDIVFTDSRPGGERMAEAVKRHKPVLAQVFALEQGGKPSVGRLAGALPWPGCPAPFAEAGGFLANAPALQAEFAGHITPRVASDGVVRKQPAIICYDGKPYPALGISALMRATETDALSLERGEGWLDPAWKLGGSTLPAGAIPLDRQGDLRVSWRLHPESFVSVSASDVLNGRVPASVLDNAWVLLGSSAFGLNDSIATPYGGTSAGMQAHLQIIAALIDGHTPYTPRLAPVGQAIAAGMGALLLLFLGYRPAAAERARPQRHRFPLYLLPLVAMLWALGLWALHAALLLQAAVWVGWLAPAAFVLLAGSAMGILAHARSRIDRDQLYALFSSYLPAPVAAALALQPPSSAITASTQQVSVMFADIRNFSAYCEMRPPEEAAAVLHAFFSTAARIVEAHGGVIEAFQGDAIFAVWNGEPIRRQADPAAARNDAARDARQALLAAVALQAAMEGVLPDPAPAGLEPLSLGIGVETGPAMAGSFGMASRRAHMVMGRTVTIASRLVDMTGELAHPILVGEGLAGLIGGAGLESMGTFLLEGMRVPHHVYAYPLVSAPRLYH